MVVGIQGPHIQPKFQLLEIITADIKMRILHKDARFQVQNSAYFPAQLAGRSRFGCQMKIVERDSLGAIASHGVAFPATAPHHYFGQGLRLGLDFNPIVRDLF
jgi:hypothetical protein